MKIVKNMPPGIYHADEAVSNSDLRLLANAPADLRAKRDGLIRPSTDALEFGELFHMATLEPERFNMEVIVKPEGMSFATKEGKAWRAEQTRRIISFGDYQQISGMAMAAKCHPVAGPFLRTNGRYELSLFADHEELGIPLRARFDKLTDDNVIIDLKSTVCARPWKFIRQAALLRYHCQVSFYLRVAAMCGIENATFVFIAVEKTPPYKVLCCDLDAQSVEKGSKEVRRLLELYKKCSDENKWPGYSEIMERLTLPDWALAEEPFESSVAYTLEETTTP